MIKMEQVVDCQSMPNDIRRKFFDKVEGYNDTYVDFWLDDEECEVVQWLGEQGATGDSIIIKHWW